ncbi:hypothetical protein CL632_02140 [bacterium]|jgi:signal peptidase II|nr:hypothetical protein [bacterium]MDP6571339.1 signal peptidase II [Patescibacteria group bacterium]MDP6756359.1 signal peptidase II [Patescibacteria group bacterium]|tara:strand:+ start:57005 stop:57430 length:426 start_codon:yes stop_codon:yes gene_type:complete
MKKSNYIIIAALGFVLDRIIKYFVLKNPSFENGFFLFDGVFGLRLHINEYFAWGLPISNTISIYLMILVILALIYAMIRMHALGLWLVLAGALSNILDRFIYNGVIDYIVVPWGGIINIADILVIAGVLVLLFYKKRGHAA